MTPSSSVRLIISLDLPALAPHRVVQTFDSRCAPNVTENSEIPLYVPSTRPFLSDPLAAVIVFSITIIGLGERHGIRMVVHRMALLNLVLPHLLDATTTAATSIPWNFWGPPVTRWLAVEEGNLFASETNMHSYGQRYVELGSLKNIDEDKEGNNDEDSGNTSDDIPGDQSIIICDFNPWRVQDVRLHPEKYAVEMRGGQSDVFEVEVVGGGSGDEDGSSDVYLTNGVFKDDIVGKLPYVQCSRSSLDWPLYDNVLIDEERLIGVQVCVSMVDDEQCLQ